MSYAPVYDVDDMGRHDDTRLPTIIALLYKRMGVFHQRATVSHLVYYETTLNPFPPVSTVTTAVTPLDVSGREVLTQWA